MSRGRKSKNIAPNWQEIFSKNVGIYFQTIITELGKSKIIGSENGIDLLTKIKLEKT